MAGWSGHPPGLYLLLWQFPVLGLLHLAEEALHASIIFVLFWLVSFVVVGFVLVWFFEMGSLKSLCEVWRKSSIYFALHFPLFPTCVDTSRKPRVYLLLPGSSPGWGAWRARNRRGYWPGKEQDVFLQRYSVGESVIWKNDLYRSSEALSEESELQCSRGWGHWGNVGRELCLREFRGPFSSIPSLSLKYQFYWLMSYLYNL